MQYSQLLQGWQKSQSSRVALRAPRTWLVSFGTLVVSLLLIAALIALGSLLHTVSSTPFTSLFSKLFGGIVAVPLLFFSLALLFALFTNRAHRVKAYQKALIMLLATSLHSYYCSESGLE